MQRLPRIAGNELQSYMITVYLIRHGEVAGNEGSDRTYAGRTDLPLNARGLQQAAALAEAMREIHLDAIYCSSLQRTRQTAEGVAHDHQLNPIANTAWDELDYGDWEALTVPEIKSGWGRLWQERQADPVHVRASGGENYLDLWQRLEPAWKQLLNNHQNQSIAVFAHKGSIRILLAALLGAPFNNFKRIQSGNTGISCIQLESPNAIPLIRYINDTSHLKFHSQQL
ncbi:MAG: histidine phosphatase family protein [Abditibacteriaceae bacterium]